MTPTLDIAHILRQETGWQPDTPLHRLLLTLLRWLIAERTLNRLLVTLDGLQGPAFIEALLAHLHVRLQWRHPPALPPDQPMIIVANHPLGALDGLCLLQALNHAGVDTVALANAWLQHIPPLQPCLLPAPVWHADGPARRHTLLAMESALTSGRSLLIFPAGEVARWQQGHIRERPWQPGFVHLARRCRVPVLPVWIGGRNRWRFHLASLIHETLGTLLLPREMLNPRQTTLPAVAGPPIPAERLAAGRPRLLASALQHYVTRHLPAASPPRPWPC